MLFIHAEANVINDNKNYKLYNNDIRFDILADQSLILSKEYIETEFYNNYYVLYSIFEDMVKHKYYSSISNINRAMKNNTISAVLKLTFIADIQKMSKKYEQYAYTVTNIEDLDKYCSGIQYEYNIISKELKRYEMYGNIVIERPLSYYDK